MPNPQRLELTWIGKENRPRLEPRILLEAPAKSYHAQHRTGQKDIFDNRLIFGDNLLALKALEQEFAGKVKCIYIDPPTFTLVGERDGIANPRAMERRVNEMKAAGIPTEFHLYRNLGHGFALGTGTNAEGWITDAIRFWEARGGR